ncbi:type I restriction enzyme, S subunit [Granulicatella balaenopterae]|uniref:Type I restriction enzyme, S subunit n=1 Tax=Granulicatella balaenopterae TaxID=137733 RepID=A0A1H9NJF4_9LACT|nr:type I restriction enzyme, S subunit [Granulicatella balaenopterae]
MGEVLTERNIKAPQSEEYPLMAFVANKGVTEKGERYDRSFLVTDNNNKKYKQTEYGDYIYSSNNLETGSVGLNLYGKAVISPVYSIFSINNNCDFHFMGELLTRKQFIKSLLKWRQGVVYGQWRIHEKDFLKAIVAIPSLQEQQQIGEFFQKQDQLITFQQRLLKN